MDSFEDRIDDDLFELIISYLPIKDKLRFESVSKRFQRFVFNKQNVLVISSFDNLSDVLFKHGQINVSLLETVLKKFRFINAISIKIIYWNESEVLNTITQNCKHLTSIDSDFIYIDFEVLKEFCQKFGQQLRHISSPQYFYSDKEVVKYLLKNSPNLLSIKYIKFEDLNEIVYKNLKKNRISIRFLVFS